MVVNKRYAITKRIKIHTKPLVEVNVVQEGIFDHETKTSFCFKGFCVRKSCVLFIEEVAENG
jgi:hypothetical protein